MDKTDFQFSIGIGLAVFTVGLTVLLFGLDKSGLFNISFAPLYVLVGFIVAIFGIVIIYQAVLDFRKSSKIV